MVVPSVHAAQIARGIELHRQDKLPEARAIYLSVLKAAPRNFDAMNLLGAIDVQVGEHEAAVDKISRALKVNPNSASAHSNLGQALMNLRRYDEALEALLKAAELDPNHVNAHQNRGDLLVTMYRYMDAVEAYQTVVKLSPGHIKAWCNMGLAYVGRQQLNEAVECFNKAIAIDPKFAKALNNRGQALRILGRYEEAAQTFAAVLYCEPGYAYVPGYLFNSQLYCCNWSAYDDNRAVIAAELMAGRAADNPMQFLSVSDSPAEQLVCAKAYTAKRHPPLEPALWQGEIYHHARVRVAYLSADFNNHATAYLMAELFEIHDRSRFEIVAFSFGPNDASPIRRRLEEAFDHFVDVSGNTDIEVAKMIRKLEIDIAVDLKGYTRDCRTDILALRPAPVQVNFLGFPCTMGAPYIDYFIADRITVPEEHHAFFSEKIVYLPGTYQVNDTKRKIADETPTRAQAGLPEEGFVFCCFNETYKLTPFVFDIWMRLLAQVEGSVLWLLDGNPVVAPNLRREAQARGISPERLIFAPRMPLANHLARYRLADLFLDTLPVNAHTTASDALWVGLPVLTCLGNAFVGRVAASLLNAVGLPELITTSLAQYEQLALELARAPERLQAMRQKLLTNQLDFPLFDLPRKRQHLETAYLEMHARTAKGVPPGPFEIVP